MTTTQVRRMEAGLHPFKGRELGDGVCRGCRWLVRRSISSRLFCEYSVCREMRCGEEWPACQHKERA